MIRLLPAFLACLVITGCAGTTFYDRQSGRKIADFRGNYINSAYSDGTTKWTAAQVDHSTPTLAGGQASAQIINAIAAGVTAALLAHGGGGAVPAVVTKLGAATIPLVGRVTSSRNPVQPVTLHR